MRIVAILSLILGISAAAYIVFAAQAVQVDNPSSFTESEAGFEAVEESVPVGYNGRYTDTELENWTRPDGPTRVGLQAGHLDNDQLPEELENLARNGAGATWGQYNERDTVEVIAQRTAERLEDEGIVVDLLPATVPPGYVADAFVSIHADGNANESVRGFKSAYFSHDYSGHSRFLRQHIDETYKAVTDLPEDTSITYRMTGYYAFNWWRYEHALHPMTPAVILETGFLTNAADRDMLVHDPEGIAQAIAEGILAYLSEDYSDLAVRGTIRVPEGPFSGALVCLEHRRDEDADCRPGLQIADGIQIGLLFPQATSTFLEAYPYGETITVDGTFSPMVALRDFSWYRYQVAGIVEVDEVGK